MTATEQLVKLREKMQLVEDAFRQHAGVLMQMDAEGTLPNSTAIKQSIRKMLLCFGVQA